MDTAQWPQEIVVKPMEDITPNTCSSLVSNSTTTNNTNNNNNNNGNNKVPSTSLERKVRPQKDHAVNCPRCNSTNTKFCYYNNYSLTQPRYFCKSCRRYWTEGGSLRNIPVGGGSRKNKRSSSSASFSSSVVKKLSSHELVAAAQSHLNTNPNDKIHPHHQDLNLGFPPTHPHEFRSLSEFMQLPTIESDPKVQIPLPVASPGSATALENTATSTENHNHHMSALELLNGLTTSRGLTPFMPMPISDHHQQHGGVYSSGFPNLQDYKPSLNFTLDGLGNGYNNLQSSVQQQGDPVTNNHSRLLFPFEDLKQVTSASGEHNNNNDNSHDHEQHRDDQGDSTNGYWSGMLGTGGPW